ncbi:hypothetical protein ETI08_01210 [Macrococcoides goetzii]|nr:hypothetical protein [Macrococcus goetzii]TDM47781.1 hypothetical protein ETI08_01210 [Macrococcus goetzii]
MFKHFKDVTRKQVEHKRLYSKTIDYVDKLNDLATKRDVIVTYCKKPTHNEAGIITWIEK